MISPKEGPSTKSSWSFNETNRRWLRKRKWQRSPASVMSKVFNDRNRLSETHWSMSTNSRQVLTNRSSRKSSDWRKNLQRRTSFSWELYLQRLRRISARPKDKTSWLLSTWWEVRLAALWATSDSCTTPPTSASWFLERSMYQGWE